MFIRAGRRFSFLGGPSSHPSAALPLGTAFPRLFLWAVSVRSKTLNLIMPQLFLGMEARFTAFSRQHPPLRLKLDRILHQQIQHSPSRAANSLVVFLSKATVVESILKQQEPLTPTRTASSLLLTIPTKLSTDLIFICTEPISHRT